MDIRLWGTRGSIPSPGPSTARYGGNTSCVTVRLSDGSMIILDAGSGIRALGSILGPCRAMLLLSHYHWDHIQGLPFFGPAYMPDSDITIIGPEEHGIGPEELLSGQMIDPYFPASMSQWVGISGYKVVRTGEVLDAGAASVRSTRLCHPSETLGYRIEDAGRTLVYISDDEPDGAPPGILDDIIDLARDADLLVHDCQYTEAEYAQKRGWGHSTPRQAVRVAREAGVRRLMIFHHDPSHSDEQVEAIAAEAQALAPQLTINIAREGETVALAAPSSVLPK